MFEDANLKKQRRATTGQGIMRMLACCWDILKHREREGGRERGLCLARLQYLDFFKSRSGTCASPSVLLDVGDDDPDEQPNYKRKCRLLKLSFISYFLETFISTALTIT